MDKKIPVATRLSKSLKDYRKKYRNYNKNIVAKLTSKIFFTTSTDSLKWMPYGS